MTILPFEFQYKPAKDENCFSYLPKMVEEIDAAANKFLNQFEFVDNLTIAEDIDKRAWAIVREHEAAGTESLIPEWAWSVVDGGIPYYGSLRNGSLHFAIGFSCASQDAHLRCFWENIKNNTEFELPFPVIAPLLV